MSHHHRDLLLRSANPDAVYLARILAYSPLAFYDTSLSNIWQASNGTTPAVADADVVGRLDDLSGNGYHYTQATTGNKPTLRTGVQNGLPIIRFDATDDVLITGNVVLPAAHTVITVGNPKKRVNGNNDTFWSYAENFGGALDAVSNVEQVVIFNSPNLQYRIRYNGLDTTATSAALAAMAIMSTRRASTTDAKGYVNGVNVIDSATVTTDPVTTNKKFRMGQVTNAAQYLNGDVAAQAIFGTALSTIDLAVVTALLNEHWAVY